jgi:hypothetical protein
MKNTLSLNGLHGLSVSGAVVLTAALAVFAESGLETASSLVGSVVHYTQQPYLLLRQLHSPADQSTSSTHGIQWPALVL